MTQCYPCTYSISIFDGEHIDGFGITLAAFSLSILSSSIVYTGRNRCCPSIFSLSNFSMKSIRQYFAPSKIVLYAYYLLLGLTPFSDGNETVNVSNLIATGIIPRPHKLLA